MQNKPICVECLREMFPAENGVYWVARTNPNDKNSELAYVICCDIWQCPHCSKSILKGFANSGEHHPTYERIHQLENNGRTVFVEGGRHDEEF
jgi:hypothetical protein